MKTKVDVKWLVVVLVAMICLMMFQEAAAQAGDPETAYPIETPEPTPTGCPECELKGIEPISIGSEIDEVQPEPIFIIRWFRILVRWVTGLRK